MNRLFLTRNSTSSTVPNPLAPSLLLQTNLAHLNMSQATTDAHSMVVYFPDLISNSNSNASSNNHTPGAH